MQQFKFTTQLIPTAGDATYGVTFVWAANEKAARRMLATHQRKAEVTKTEVIDTWEPAPDGDAACAASPMPSGTDTRQARGYRQS